MGKILKVVSPMPAASHSTKSSNQKEKRAIAKVKVSVDKAKIARKIARSQAPVPAPRVHASKTKYTRKVKHRKQPE